MKTTYIQINKKLLAEVLEEDCENETLFHVAIWEGRKRDAIWSRINLKSIDEVHAQIREFGMTR